MNQLNNKNMKAEEIIKIIEENKLHKILFALMDGFEYVENPETGEDFESKEQGLEYLGKGGLKNMETVASECNSDIMFAVIHFKDENIFIKIDGEYDSYGEGDHYYEGSVTQVFPKEITKTVYA